jgi:hypothetical protein
MNQLNQYPLFRTSWALLSWPNDKREKAIASTRKPKYLKSKKSLRAFL